MYDINFNVVDISNFVILFQQVIVLKFKFCSFHTLNFMGFDDILRFCFNLKHLSIEFDFHDNDISIYAPQNQHQNIVNLTVLNTIAYTDTSDFISQFLKSNPQIEILKINIVVFFENEILFRASQIFPAI